jgi:hypothetical protein
MLHDDLLVPTRFADAVQRLAARRWGSPSAPSLQQHGVSLATLARERHTFARLLVADLKRGHVTPSPGRVYWIEKEQKQRRLFDFPLTELVIHDAVACWLAERLSPSISPHLYSYQPGTSYHRALAGFARYVRTATRIAPSRGLYVLRRDVHSYFDSIPVHDDAPLWPLLRRLVGDVREFDVTWSLVCRTLRPPLVDRAGTLYTLDCGIPTGSPVANVVANAYLGAMDDDLSRVPDAFYARYGDDLVAAHPDAAVAARLAAMLAAHLGGQGLEFSEAKTHDVYLSPRGALPALEHGPQSAAAVELLGHRVSVAGTVSLSVRKTKTLLADLRTRAANGANVDAPIDERVAGAVRASNRFFDPDAPAAHPYAALLRTTVTDRSYLKWLDYEVALIVVGAAMRQRSVRHFRSFPPGALRARFGLDSLVVGRNRGMRTR